MKRLNYFLPVILPFFLTCGIFPFGPSDAVVPTIFFSAADVGYGASQIFSVKIDGSEFTRLTERDNAGYYSISLSPDGQYITYERGGNDVFTMNIDGSDKKQLTFDIIAMEPSWSPDGSEIAFFNYVVNGGDHIYVMNADGSDPVKLIDTPELRGKPQWMPDGSQIYYNSRDGLFLMDRDGSNNTLLTDFELQIEKLLYSPEDRSLNFVQRIDNQYFLYKIKIDETGLTLVRSFPEEQYNLSLSPDLQKIAYKKSDDPDEGIYVMNIDGSGETLLTRSDFSTGNIIWSPDSQYILYIDLDNTPVFVFDTLQILNIIRSDGTDQTLVTDQIHRFFPGISWLF